MPPLLLAALLLGQVAPPASMPPRLLRTLAHQPDGYNPGHTHSTDLLFGDLLFHSPDVLGPKARAEGISCQTCHPNGAAHRTFFLKDLSDQPGNVDLSTSHFRTGSLPEFIQSVVSLEFAGVPLAPGALAALVRYVQDLDFVPNRNLDVHGRLTRFANASARRGEAIFAAPRLQFQGESCATCHTPSSYFRDGRIHRLGTGDRASPYGLDDGYRTPTLLGTAETAPYFHDGRFASLGEVVGWFDDAYRLGLSGKQRSDLTAYLAAVGATDVTEDDRPLPQRMVEKAAYLTLLLDGESQDDRSVWRMALRAASEGFDALSGEVPELSARKQLLESRLQELSTQCATAELAALRPQVRALQSEMIRLGADWSGAQASRQSAGEQGP